MTRIGIIGAGIICGDHVAAIDRRDDAKLVAVCDLDAKKAERFALERGAAVYTDYKQMIEQCPMDMVIINLPHKLHLESAVLCAQKGLHVLLEKPMAVSVGDCDAIIAAAEENNVTLMIGHVQQYQAGYRRAREILRSGELGDLVSIYDLRTIHYFKEERPKWFVTPEISGGGIAINLGAHSMDRIHFLTGSRVKRAFGKAAHWYPEQRVESNLSAFLEMESGALATVTIVGTNVPVMNETTCFCTRGMLRMRFGRLFMSKDDGEPEEVPLERERGMSLQLDDFLAAMRGERPVAIPGSYGREIIRIITDLYAQSK